MKISGVQPQIGQTSRKCGVNLMRSVRNAVNSDSFTKIINKPNFTKWSVVGLILINAVVRPWAILTNKDAEKDQKKYSASREVLQQGFCLISHLTLTSLFNTLGFVIGKKFLKSTEAKKAFNEFQTVEAATKGIPNKILNALKKAIPDKKLFNKITETAADLKAAIIKDGNLLKNLKDNGITQAAIEKISDVPQVIKGSMGIGSIIGTIVALAVVAPMLNNMFLNPILNKLGIKFDENKKQKPADNLSVIYENFLKKTAKPPEMFKNIIQSENIKH